MGIKHGKSPGRGSTTEVKYLNVDKGYMYIARVQIKGKHFVVWRGANKAIGKMVAEKLQDLMLKGDGAFLDWYDYEMEDWLKENKLQRRAK